MKDGSEIIDERVYSVIALNFLTGGGDDFKKVINGFTDEETNTVYEPISLKNLTTLGISRDIVLEELK